MTNLYHHSDHGTRRFTVRDRSDGVGVVLTDVTTGETMHSDHGPVYYCSDFCRCTEPRKDNQT